MASNRSSYRIVLSCWKLNKDNDTHASELLKKLFQAHRISDLSVSFRFSLLSPDYI